MFLFYEPQNLSVGGMEGIKILLEAGRQILSSLAQGPAVICTHIPPSTASDKGLKNGPCNSVLRWARSPEDFQIEMRHSFIHPHFQKKDSSYLQANQNSRLLPEDFKWQTVAQV